MNRLLVAVLVLGILAIPAIVIYVNHEQGVQVNRIQASRVASCKATYRAIEEVALFFFRPPTQRTAQERRVVAGLHRQILGDISRCDQQTRPKGP